MLECNQLLPLLQVSGFLSFRSWVLFSSVGRAASRYRRFVLTAAAPGLSPSLGPFDACHSPSLSQPVACHDFNCPVKGKKCTKSQLFTPGWRWWYHVKLHNLRHPCHVSLSGRGLNKTGKPVFFFKYFFYLLSALLIEQLEIDRKQDEREGEWHMAKGPRPGLEPGVTARTKPLHMGRPLYHLS